MLSTAIDPNSSNREFAVQRARTATERAEDITKDESTSLFNAASIARLGEIVDSGKGGIYANKLGIGDIKSLRDISATNPADAAAQMRMAGIPANSIEVVGELDKMLEAAQMKILERGGVPNSANVKGMLKSINSRSGLPTDADEQLREGEVAVAGGFANVQAMEGALRGVTAKNDPNAKNAVITAVTGKSGGSELQDADKLLTSGFSQLSEAASSAAKQLGGAAAAMEKLVQLQSLANKEGGDKGEGEFSGAAAKSAGSTMWNDGVKKFDTAASKWDTIADKLIQSGIGQKSSSNTPMNTNSQDYKAGKSP
jgi:hypothetical protein